MTRARNLGKLANTNTLTADNTNNFVGIASTQPTTRLDVVGVVSATSFSGNGANLTGVTATDVGTLGNLNVTGAGTFGGNVTIGGTLTYDDVTNVDSVGVITAKAGLNVVGGGATVTGVSTFFSDVSIAGVLTLHNHLDMQDDDIIKLGTGDDLQMYHDGTNSTITNTTGDLYITDSGGNIYIQSKHGEQSIVAFADGAVDLYYDNSKKFETNSDGVKTLGDHFFAGTSGNAIWDQSADNFFHGDNVKASFGNANDLQLYHDATDSFITHSGPGDLYIKTATDDKDVIIESDNGSGGFDPYILCDGSHGSVRLYYYGDQKLETTSSGVTVTGTVSDSKGELRTLPKNSQSGTYTLVAADAGKFIEAENTVTVPAGVFAAGEMVTILNQTSGDITITKGSGLTLYNAADGDNNSRTLSTRGMATILYASGSTAHISGAGLS